jgi:FixJ family two-component response regulator
MLDIHMPGMNGLALQQRLADEGRQIPIVFVTAFTDEAARNTAMDSGAICFLTKPFKEADLLDDLRSALASSDSRQKSQPF